MASVDSARFVGTSGTIPSGQSFTVNATLINTLPQAQRYRINLVYAPRGGDPLSSGITPGKSVEVTVPPATYGGKAYVELNGAVTGSSGVRISVYILGYPDCPRQRRPIDDCTNILYKVGDITIVTPVPATNYLQRADFTTTNPLGVMYPGRVWEGQLIRGYGGYGTPGAGQGYAVGPGGGRGKVTDDGECNVYIAVPANTTQYNDMMQYAQYSRSYNDPHPVTRKPCPYQMYFPKGELGEEWKYCATSYYPPTTNADRQLSNLYGAAYNDWMYKYGEWKRKQEEVPPIPPPPPPQPEKICGVDYCTDKERYKCQNGECVAKVCGVDYCTDADHQCDGGTCIPKPPPPCEKPMCYPPGDPDLINACKTHKDRWGNIIVDVWEKGNECEGTSTEAPCFVKNRADPMLQNAKLKHTDDCGYIVVDEWCPGSGGVGDCVRSTDDPKFKERQLVDWTRDRCGCIIPKVRLLTKEELEKLNTAKSQIVIAKRSVLVEGKPFAIYYVLPRAPVSPFYE